MNDEHNRHDPFAAPEPERFETPRITDPEPPRAAQISERVEGSEPTVSPEHAASPFVHTPADAPPSAFAYSPVDPPPHDPLIGPDPLLASEHGAVAAHDPRLALDGTSLWLNRLGEELVAWLKTLASAAVYATLIVTFGFQVARVEGMSMAPTLQDQDRLIVNKLAYRLSDPKVGDIVMLYYPLKPEKSFVKRIIAEEGDQVRIVDGRVFRNDVPLDDSYVPPEFRSHDDWGPRVIDEGYYFVMGDHRNNSSDSRHWGLVPKKYIIGKVQLRWWPMGHARVF